MHTNALLAVLLLGVRWVQAKLVFAHFMVTNSGNYTAADWSDEISKAQAAHISAFALNMAKGDPVNDAGVQAAFAAAAGTGFQLFFSFDYAGNGPWDASVVTEYINNYKGNSAYYHYNGGPFVSTFEGPGNAADWTGIKQATGCFFVPDWSSRGAKAAMALANGVADGLFSWAAWPWGPNEMNTYVDASYMDYLNGKPYMMPISPWFFTNLPGYNKNWLWRGDSIWFDRWQEALYLQPECIEIISWNDYGESHYIGPLRSKAYEAFTVGEAPYNFADGMDHDAWRLTLPYAIDLYVKNVTTIPNELLTVWTRLNPAHSCSTGGTTGNTATQLQIEFQPYDLMQDSVFFSALLTSVPLSASVTIGGGGVPVTWISSPQNGVGLYHGSAPFNGNTGAVAVSVSTISGSISVSSGSKQITTACTNGINNWNAWVGGSVGVGITRRLPSPNNYVCINGTGVYNFIGLCDWGCAIGYCPIGACYCKEMGIQVPKPSPTNINAYPVAGLDESYSGLCAFDCANGYCPPSICSNVSVPLQTPTVSDFLPPACVQGHALNPNTYGGLCSFGCARGFCPIHACVCDAQGALWDTQPTVATVGSPSSGDDYGLCDFACKRGYCPAPTCTNTTSTGGGGVGNTGGYPITTNGQCTGPDCVNGVCTGSLCVSFGCSGSDCFNGVCTGPNCVASGCIGPNCNNGVCTGNGCLTIGCVGSDCNNSNDNDSNSGEEDGGGHGHGKNGHCVGLDCLSIGCVGLDCSSTSQQGGGRDCPAGGCDGICRGPDCSIVTCFGPQCLDGSCIGPICSHAGTAPGGGDGAPPDNPDAECSSPQTTASVCNVFCQTAPTSTCQTDCVPSIGCSATSTTSTTTISSNAYFIPTPVYDSYGNDDSADQFVMSIVASITSSEDAADAQSSTLTTSSTSQSSSAPTGATLCLGNRVVSGSSSTSPVWSLYAPGQGCAASVAAFTGSSGNTFCNLNGESYNSVCGGAYFTAITSGSTCQLDITVNGVQWAGTTLSQGRNLCDQACTSGTTTLQLQGVVSWSGPVC